jgi:Zn-dependent protease
MTVGASYLLGLSVIGLHETAHIATAMLFGLTIKRVGLSWKGPYIVRESGSPGANLITTLAAPLFNLLLAVLWPIAPDFAMVNLIFGLSNLIPYGGSDGQRAWRMVTNGCREAGIEPSRWIAQTVGSVLAS